jgi:hypothetical protein
MFVERSHALSFILVFDFACRLPPQLGEFDMAVRRNRKSFPLWGGGAKTSGL